MHIAFRSPTRRLIDSRLSNLRLPSRFRPWLPLLHHPPPSLRSTLLLSPHHPQMPMPSANHAPLVHMSIASDRLLTSSSLSVFSSPTHNGNAICSPTGSMSPSVLLRCSCWYGRSSSAWTVHPSASPAPSSPCFSSLRCSSSPTISPPASSRARTARKCCSLHCWRCSRRRVTFASATCQSCSRRASSSSPRARSSPRAKSASSPAGSPPPSSPPSPSPSSSTSSAAGR